MWVPSSEVRFMAVEQQSQASAGGFTPLSTDVFHGQQKGHPLSEKPPPLCVCVVGQGRSPWLLLGEGVQAPNGKTVLSVFSMMWFHSLRSPAAGDVPIKQERGICQSSSQWQPHWISKHLWSSTKTGVLCGPHAPMRDIYHCTCCLVMGRKTSIFDLVSVQTKPFTYTCVCAW